MPIVAADPTSPSKRISAISTAAKTASEPSMATIAAAPQPQAKQSSSLRGNAVIVLCRFQHSPEFTVEGVLHHL